MGVYLNDEQDHDHGQGRTGNSIPSHPIHQLHLNTAIDIFTTRASHIDFPPTQLIPPPLQHEELTGSKIRHIVVGGRYGLGSKEFTPAMAVACFDNLLLDKPKRKFTVRGQSKQLEESHSILDNVCVDLSTRRVTLHT